MDAINEQREIANEISEAISNPMGNTLELDEVTHLDSLHVHLSDSHEYRRN